MIFSLGKFFSLMSLFLTLTLTSSTLVEAAPQSLTLTTEELAPFNYIDPKDKVLKGIAIDINAEVMKRAGLKFEVQMMPWARAYQNALENNWTCAFATYRTEKRDPLFKWVGPLLTAKWSFYALPDSKLVINKIEDAKKLVIGGYLSDAPTGHLVDLGFNLDQAPENALNVKKLQEGRIQVWATGDPSGTYIAKMQGVELKNLFTFQTIDMSYSCNKQVPDEVIAKMQKALDEMEKEGLAEKIRKNY